MNRRIQKILFAAMATMLLMTIVPPVTAMSYDYSGGITRVSPVIRYAFLFTTSYTEINFNRLSLQYLIVLIVSTWLVLSQKKFAASLDRRVAELSVANDKLLQHITDGKLTEGQLKREAVELKAAKEKLGRQINELKDAEQKWHTCRDQLERQMNERVSELRRAKEQFEQQAAQRRQLEERLECQRNELASANEKIQHEADKCRILEKQFAEYRQKYNQLFKQHSAQVDKYNERLQETIEEPESLAQSDERLEQPKIPSRLFNVQEMKSLAELATRLSRK